MSGADDTLADIDAALEDWELGPDATRWAADGSHEVEELGGDYYLQDRRVHTDVGCLCDACLSRLLGQLLGRDLWRTLNARLVESMEQFVTSMHQFERDVAEEMQQFTLTPPPRGPSYGWTVYLDEAHRVQAQDYAYWEPPARDPLEQVHAVAERAEQLQAERDAPIPAELWRAAASRAIDAAPAPVERPSGIDAQRSPYRGQLRGRRRPRDD